MARNASYYRYLRYRQRSRRRRNGNGLERWLAGLALVGALVAFGLAGAGYGIYQSYVPGLIPPDEAIAKLPSGARIGASIYDRHGNLLFAYLSEEYVQRHPVPLSEMSPYLIGATIATEDNSFMTNPGINLQGLLLAAWENLSPLSDSPGFFQGRGGSSMTQQLVKNIYFSPEERTQRSIARKVKEAIYALELTQRFSKRQILQWYLNQIPYGHVYVGVEVASQGYFGKHALDLTLAEAATLAAIPNCPICYDPISEPEAARERRNDVLRLMYEEGYIGPQQLRDTVLLPIEVVSQRFSVKAPHFVFNYVRPQLERLLGEETLLRGGLDVYTSLDLELQQRAEAIMEQRISSHEASAGGHNGAFVAIDPKTAQILAYVGGRDYFRQDIQGRNDMVSAGHSIGSVIKPITSLTAFMNLGWGLGTWNLDTPATVQGGIATLDQPNLGSTFATGSADVRLIDMVYGYTVLPNLGILKGVPTTSALPGGSRSLDPVAILRVESRDGQVLYPVVDGEPVPNGPVLQKRRVAPAEEAYLITDILVDRNAECRTFGCAGFGIPEEPPAVETSTSAPYRNRRAAGTWTFAYTPQIVVGSWFGNADNSPLGRGVSSTTVSWPIVLDFIAAYHRDKPVEPFAKPGGKAILDSQD